MKILCLNPSNFQSAGAALSYLFPVEVVLKKSPEDSDFIDIFWLFNQRSMYK